MELDLAELACRRLDRWRLKALRVGGHRLLPFIRRREWRVAAFGTAAVGFALCCAVLFPYWTLALGPLILGAPHLVADLRYLVFQPRLHRSLVFWGCMGAPLVAVGVGMGGIFGMTAVFSAAVVATGGWRRKLPILLLAGAGGWAAVSAEEVFQPAMAHLHNFVAVALWWFWRPRRGWLPRIVPLAFVASCLALLFGWLEPSFWGWNAMPGSLSAELQTTLSGGLPQPWGLRLVILFAFAQSVHYAIWLRLLPEDSRNQPTPRSYAASWRALRADMGCFTLWVACAVSVALAVWAVADMSGARAGYFRLALFHGYLELAVGALMFVQRGRISLETR